MHGIEHHALPAKFRPPRGRSLRAGRPLAELGVRSLPTNTEVFVGRSLTG